MKINKKIKTSKSFSEMNSQGLLVSKHRFLLDKLYTYSKIIHIRGGVLALGALIATFLTDVSNSIPAILVLYAIIGIGFYEAWQLHKRLTKSFKFGSHYVMNRHKKIVLKLVDSMEESKNMAGMVALLKKILEENIK